VHELEQWRRDWNKMQHGTTIKIITLHVSDNLFVHHQESKTVHIASGICHVEIPKRVKLLLSLYLPILFYILLLCMYKINSIFTHFGILVWHIRDAVCTVLNSWWWTERSSGTCRVIFSKLDDCASSWFYYRNIE
jgi:hypothetical protein